MQLRTGQKVVCRTQTFSAVPQVMLGTVVWIHPQKRFARVAFELHGKLETMTLMERFAFSEIRMARK